MDTKKIELLLSAVNMGSIKKAAKALNYTQSGLGYVLNVFEKELGITLIHRDEKGISFTVEGEFLRPYLEDIVEAVRRFDEQASKLSRSKPCTLNIGAWPSIARNWLPDFIQKFGAENPDVNIVLHVGTNELSAMLDKGIVDFVIGPSHLAEGKDFCLLKSQEIYAVVPANAPFKEDEPVSLKELEKYIVLLPENHPQGPGAQDFAEWSRNLSAFQKLRISATDGSIKMSMVEKGSAVTFLASVYKSECPPGVRMLPLDLPIYSTTVLAKSSVRIATSVMDKFADEIQAFIQALQI